MIKEDARHIATKVSLVWDETSNRAHCFIAGVEAPVELEVESPAEFERMWHTCTDASRYPVDTWTADLADDDGVIRVVKDVEHVIVDDFGSYTATTTTPREALDRRLQWLCKTWVTLADAFTEYKCTVNDVPYEGKVYWSFHPFGITANFQWVRKCL